MLTKQQAATRLGVSLSTVKRLIATGDLEAFNAAPKDSRRLVRITPEAIDRFISRRSGKPKTKAQPRRSSTEGVIEFF